jgi:hypothetical protein
MTGGDDGDAALASVPLVVHFDDDCVVALLETDARLGDELTSIRHDPGQLKTRHARPLEQWDLYTLLAIVSGDRTPARATDLGPRVVAVLLALLDAVVVRLLTASIPLRLVLGLGAAIEVFLVTSRQAEDQRR